MRSEVPTLVVQGESDPFGMPPPGANREVVKVAGNHGLKADLDAVRRRGLGMAARDRGLSRAKRYFCSATIVFTGAVCAARELDLDHVGADLADRVVEAGSCGGRP